MANDILKLQEYEIKDIVKKTNLEGVYIEYMINGEFDKLKNANVAAFVKILSREYDLDLTEWLAQYEAYKNEHKNEQKEGGINPKLPSYTPPQTGTPMWLFIVILALIGGIIWVASNTEMLREFFANNQTPAAITQSTEVQNANEAIKNGETRLNEPAQNEPVFDPTSSDSTNSDSAINSSAQTTEPAVQPVADPASAPAPSEPVSAPEPTPPPTNIAAPSEPANTDAAEPQATKPISVKIIPNKPLWIGIKSTDGKQRRNTTIKEALEIDLNKDAIILTGHGNLTIEKDGQKEAFANRAAMRFAVQNGEFKIINQEEFTKLNGGKVAW